MDNKQKVKILKDGPYVISGSIPLSKEEFVLGGDGEPVSYKITFTYPLKSNYSLCRCGKSANFPFCDATHVKIKYDGTETAARKSFMEMAEKTVGPEIDLYDAKCFCSIARFCIPAGDTWTLTENSNDPASKKLAIEEACNCPSGRLVAWDKKINKPIEPGFEPAISLLEDTKHNVRGPFWLKGGISLESSDGYQYEVRNRVNICGCGRSINKPFCNGAHLHDHRK